VNDKAKVPILHNKFGKQYYVHYAWAKGNIAKYHRKLSGQRSADFKFLFPHLECSTCCFPNEEAFIPIGEKSYTNVCATTDVWLDGDFISAFESLVCHNNHSLAPTAPGMVQANVGQKRLKRNILRRFFYRSCAS
jgi:hypothetical protein